ncbi:MAG TPA: adenylate/guanylate cyclase domain-containing protein [Methylomirabilota bacterium]
MIRRIWLRAWGPLRSPFAVAGLIALVIGMAVLGSRQLGLLETLELAAYDWYVRIVARETTPDPRILLVAITEEDIQKIGDWPLHDETLATVIERLLRGGAQAVGVDIYRDVPVPPGTQRFHELLRGDPRTVVVTKFAEGTKRGVRPPPVLEGTDQVGFNDILVDPGGTVRRALLFLDDGTVSLPSFPLQLALRYLQPRNVIPQADPVDPSLFRLGHTTIRPLDSSEGGYVRADARGYQFMLDYSGSRGAFETVTFIEVLDGTVNPALIKDRVALIGVVAESIRDEFYTPLSRGLQADQHVAGMAVHAQIVSQLMQIGLDGVRPMASLPDWQEAGWILLWSGLGALVGFAVRSPWKLSLAGVGGLVALGAVDLALFVERWWLPLVPPALAWVGSAALVTGYVSYREMLDRSSLMRLFSRHVSKEVAETIWRDRDQFLDGGRPRSQRLVATMLFTDIAGYTPVAERLAPEDLMEWLNTFMDGMARQVTAHHGVIRQYAGDAIVVAFGVPAPRKTEEEIDRDAVNAVACALAMGETLRELNRRWGAQGLPTSGIRIGIFTGPVVGGTLGSAERSEYLVVGDAVNTAARLESLDKDLFAPDPNVQPCRILIGDTTLAHLGNRFETEYVANLALKGKQQRVDVYRVIGPASPDAATAEIASREVRA